MIAEWMHRYCCAWCFDHQTPSRSGLRLIVAFQARWFQRRAFEHWIGCGSARNSRTPKLAPRRPAVLAVMTSLELVEIDATVLDGAAQPMPTELGTLDVIHLAQCPALPREYRRRTNDGDS